MITTYTGPMFSGKSESLILIYNKMHNKNIIMAFKPANDSRDENYIKSKNSDTKIPATYITDLSEIEKYIEGKDIHTIFIDEAQFLTGDVQILTELSVEREINFYIAGLDLTSEQKPFGLMPDILSISNDIEKIKGFCEECNNPSIYTYFDGEKDGDVLVGDGNYKSLCPSCLKKKLVRRKGSTHAR